MQISVTSRSVRIGRSARNVRSSAEDSMSRGGRWLPAATAAAVSSVPAELTAGRDWAKLIDAAEVKIARDQHLDAITLGLRHRRRNSNRLLQHLGYDIA